MTKKTWAQSAAERFELEDQERLQQHATFRCAWCPDWKAEGPLADELHKQHRLEVHPEIKPTKRRKRTMKVTEKTLEETIAGTRAQGGHRWE